MSGFEIKDRRGMGRTPSGLYVANDADVARMRAAGMTLPVNPVRARLTAKQVVSDIGEARSSRESAANIANRAIAAEMRRKANANGQRTAANMQMVLPKMRQPLSSLMDKGIPFNTQDADELIELRRWCRVFYATHDLVPLLVDIYSTFPVQGLEFKSKDPKIDEFYTDMFMNELNYEDFLPNGLMREYYTVGEVNAFSHFNEELGTWGSEEILDPDTLRVSNSLFVEEERVQWLVKDLVDSLREASDPTTESPSERLERQYQYRMLIQHYPSIVKAAMQDDGLDMSNALVSRMVNKATWTDTRGTPIMLRSFRTLMLEESLHAAEDAICVPAGTPVLTETGVSCIEDIRAGDRVLTHRGRYREVVRPMARQADEPGVTIRWWYDRPLTLTGEHPVYVRRPINRPSRYHMHEHREWSEGFIPAREVQTYDQVLHPSSPDSGKEYVSIWEHLDQSEWVTYDPADEALGLSGHAFYQAAQGQSRRAMVRAIHKHVVGHAAPGDVIRGAWMNHTTRPYLSTEFKLTEDFLWLIGLHVADGCADHKSVRITLGEGETHLADRAIRVFRDVFGVQARLSHMGHRSDGSSIKAISVQVHNIVLAKFFRAMCGAKDTKRFPSWAFGLTERQGAAMAEGWLDGDGCTDEVRTLGTSAYRHLQESAAWLIRRAGGVTSVFSGQAEVRKGWTGGSVTTVKTPRRASPAEQGGYWAEVRSVDHHQVTETVYNLEVDEDHSYCAPIAVHNCDRLYAPMILATLGIENMGDGQPWIPDQAALDELRDDIQAALAGDFKVITHNMGLQITSVFGRESVPNLSNDYDRCDAKVMQAWGIGQSLIMGGTGGGGTYASSAINREVCEQLMKNAQDKAKAHLKKRMEIIAEAQEHYDYELKGGVRKPIYREVEQYNEETGEKEIVRVPKLLTPEPNFATLNLRDESTERAFITQLKQLGVPISDGFLALNVQVDFTQELEKQAEESYAKGLAQSQAMDKLQKRLDADGLPYPAELVQFLSATLTLRQQLAQTETLDTQNKMMDQQMAQASPAGQLGLLPGTTMQPLAGAGMMQALGADPTQAGLPPGQGGDVDPAAAQQSAAGLADGAMSQAEPVTDPSAGGGMQMAASFHGPEMRGPQMAPPGGAAPDPLPEIPGGDMEVARNRSLNRPPESDEQRGTMPKVSRIVVADKKNLEDLMLFTGNTDLKIGDRVELERDPMAVEVGPSSYRHSHKVSRERVKQAIRRREILAMGNPTVAQLVIDPDFWFTVQMGAYQGQVIADWPEIQAGGAPESRKILEEAVEQYEEITGTEPQW
jgi:hypothetical protein